MTYVGAPHVYYGDEIATEGQGDPDCRRPFYWKWNEDAERRSTHDYYRTLIGIRHALPALRQGSFRTVFASGAIYAYLREYHDQRVLVVLNNSPAAVETELPVGELALAAGASFKDRIDGTVLRPGGESLRVALGPFGGRILVIE